MSPLNQSWDKLRWLFHYEGWLFTLFRVLVKTSSFLGTKGTKSAWFQRLAERRFDRRFQITTEGIMTPQQLQYTANQQQHAVEYCSTSNCLFGQLLSRLPIDYSEFTFIDLGAGKGRAMLMASEFPFQRVIGVELSEQLHAIAEKNVHTFCGHRRCPLVESVCCDATQFSFPVDSLVLYLFNPFSQTILAQVIENLTASLAHVPRPVIVIYYNPLHAGVIDEAGGFREWRVCADDFSLPSDWRVFAFEHDAQVKTKNDKVPQLL